MELIETNHVIFGKESGRDAVLQTLSNRVLELGYSKVDLVPDFLRREEEFSTAIGFGISIPHAKSDNVLHPGVFVFKGENKIDWNGEEVQVAIAILTPLEGADTHLQILAKLSRKLMHKEFREALFNASSEKEVVDVLMFEE